MFGKDAFLDDLAPPQPTVVLPPTIARPTDIFDGPSHTLPPVGLLFDAFMSQLLKPTFGAKEPVSNVKVEEVTYIANEEEQEIKDQKATTSGRAPKTNKVTEQDMKDLEVFFKDVLSSAPAPTQPSQKMANGGGNTPKSTPTKSVVNGAGKTASAINGEVNGTSTPTDESREKKHTKKRRAPKE
jgi:NET1-associated nuclear protein 1 (U3 small nucleolar RNA-associated protein 17)